jgi:hypothetical protein
LAEKLPTIIDNRDDNTALEALKMLLPETKVLDVAWKDFAWPPRLREQIMEYNILDFSKWRDEGEFGKMFRKLIDGLDLFYKEDNAEKAYAMANQKQVERLRWSMIGRNK